jgi:serine/threonine-protein kinase
VAEADGGSVAVKILLASLRRDENSLAEFAAESRLLISLDHPNIVKGLSTGEHDGLVFLTMEWVEGRSVQEHLDQAGRFGEDAALYIILQTARALTYLHEQGLVHRDIKPGNILIDHANTVKICDLGLAIRAGAGGGQEVTAGTAHYIAPEQATAEGGLDVRCDIYALGVTLYQLVVGRLPFEGETNQETMAKRLLDELRSPELKGLGISPHLHYFIQKMMALDREVRYQSPSELIDDIEEQIQGKKTLTAQPGKSRPGALELERPFQVEAPRIVFKKTPPGGRPAPRGEWPPRRRPGPR